MQQTTGRGAVRDARRALVQAQARLAEAGVAYADARREEDRRDPRFGVDGAGALRARPGEFAADELAVAWRESPWAVRGLLARSRRVRSGLPTVWEAHRRGEVDTEQVRVVDRAARRATEAATVAQIDAHAVDAAQTRDARQLASWLLRLVVEHEPLAFAQRHRRALADRRVTISQGPDGMGHVTGELSTGDVAQIDQLLTALARDLGPADQRTEQQRRADLMADLLLGRLQLVEAGEEEDECLPPSDDRDPAPAGDRDPAASGDAEDVPSGDAEDVPSGDAGDVQWVEVEDVDLDTGELLGTHLEAVDADGVPVEQPIERHVERPVGSATGSPFGVRTQRPSRTLRVGVVVPLSSLLGLTDYPGQLPDRSGAVPAAVLREAIATALAEGAGGGEAGGGGRRRGARHVDEVLFTRLLTDDGGRLLDVRELGRFPSRRLAEAVALRAGTCRYPACSVPADRCDLDHHEPVPRGHTEAANLDPACRRHHRGKTFAWLATVRDRDAVDWTLPDHETYRCLDDPLPTGVPVA